MCHTSQSWYAASQEQAEAQNRVPQKVAPRGVGSQWCNRLYRTSTSPRECRGVRSMVMRRLSALLATGVLVALVALALSSCGGGASGAGSSGGGEHHQQAKARPLPEGKKPLPPGD